MGVLYMGMNSKCAWDSAVRVLCGDDGDNDDDGRAYYHNRNPRAPVTKTCVCAYSLVF